MPMVVKHTKVHPSGRVEYRRAFPEHLRPFTGGKDVAPRREHKVSLGLPGTPGFLARYEAAAAQFEEIVAKAQRRHDGAFDVLDGPMIAWLAETFRVEMLENDDAARWDESGAELRRSVVADLKERGVRFRGHEGRSDRAEWAERSRARLGAELPFLKHLRAQGELDLIVHHWATDVFDLIEAQGKMFAPDAYSEFRQLCRAINDAAIEAGEMRLKRLDGEQVSTPALPAEPQREAQPAVQKAERPSKAKVPLLATFEAYADAKSVTPGVRSEWRNYIAKLIEFLGHDDAARVSSDDLRTWRDLLLSEAGAEGPVRAPVTVRDKYITSARAVLTYAVDEQLIPTNPADGVKVYVPKKVKLRERAFKIEEAEAILAATLKPTRNRLAPGHALARRWLPWLQAYSGARVNELSQLRAEDIHEVEGVWAIRITPEAGTVKTKTARLVPLHPHLIEQGFLAVVKAKGAGPLFYDPAKTRVQAEGNRHFKKVGEKLAQWVRDEVGISDPDLQPNHAWRHLFKFLSYDVGMEERMADAIQGHAPTTTARGYGGPPSIKAKAEAIGRIPRFLSGGEG